LSKADLVHQRAEFGSLMNNFCGAEPIVVRLRS